MLVYHNSKKQFDKDVVLSVIADKIKKELKDKGINDENEREFRSWENSMNFMRNVLDDRDIPLDADISIEYQIPQTSKRVDFIISGSDTNNKDNVVIVELKQWEKAEKINNLQTHSVKTYVAQALRDEPHPSYQAYSYALHIKNYSQTVEDLDIGLYPCAFLHNFKEEYRDVLNDDIYSIWYREAPFFLKSDVLKLRDFIKKYINKKSINGDLLFRIDGGRIRPAKALQDCLASMLKGNKEFTLLDDQVTIYDKCLNLMTDTEFDKEKRVVIIQGGPGTGKSVLAVNLLCDLLKRSLNVAYVTKNSAPRNCYLNILSKDDIRKRVQVKDLFRSPFNLCKVPENGYDCLIVDEAHRLVKQMYGDFQGENQIKECIEASRLTIFMLDENQRITTKDIGSLQGIINWAHMLGIKDDRIFYGDNYKLLSQFRCDGSDGYIAFIDNLLEKRKTANQYFDFENFEFKVYDDPNKMREDLRIKNNINNKARMVAGYCFDWNVKNHRGDYDIYLDNDFKAKWNLESDKVWAVNPTSFDEVGCIHTCQGLEFDYVGVIIGDDLRYANGHVITDKNMISNDDKSSGIRTCKSPILADELIKNTYKVLLTRGQKGCYVYCKDKALSDYIKSIIKE